VKWKHGSRKDTHTKSNGPRKVWVCRVGRRRCVWGWDVKFYCSGHELCPTFVRFYGHNLSKPTAKNLASRFLLSSIGES
jgi:hypothetical protein